SPGEQLQGIGGAVVEEQRLGGIPALDAVGFLTLGELADLGDGLVELLAVAGQPMKGGAIAKPLDSLAIGRRIVAAGQFFPAAPLLEQARRQVRPPRLLRRVQRPRHVALGPAQVEEYFPLFTWLTLLGGKLLVVGDPFVEFAAEQVVGDIVGDRRLWLA